MTDACVFSFLSQANLTPTTLPPLGRPVSPTVGRVLPLHCVGQTYNIPSFSLAGVFEVRATSGNTHLGGEDFDQRIMKYCISQVNSTFTYTRNKSHPGDNLPPSPPMVTFS